MKKILYMILIFPVMIIIGCLPNANSESNPDPTPEPTPDLTLEPPATPTPDPTPDPTPGITGPTVIIDDELVDIGSVKDEDDTRTVTFDPEALDAQIDDATDYVRVVLPADDKISTFEAIFVVKNIDDMADKDMTLIITVGTVNYEIPTTAIDTTSVMEALGATDPAIVPITVSITKSVDDYTQTVVDSTLRYADMQQIGESMQFNITAYYNGQTVEVENFNQFVGRTIQITAEQARRITTGLVIEDNGSRRHVPTDVFSNTYGRHFATINSLTNSTYVLVYNDVYFADARGTWFEASVNQMASRTIVNGRDTGNFDGNDNITRAEFAAIVIRALGLQNNGASEIFTDVNRHTWYSGYVGKAFEYGIVTGVGFGLYEPHRQITRQEAMLMVQRAANIAQMQGNTADINAFPDAANVSSWALDAAQWNVGSGLIQGRDGRLDPQENITRAETATIILRLLQGAELVDVRAHNQPN